MTASGWTRTGRPATGSALLLGALATLVAGGAAAQSVVRGRVIESGTGQPIAGASVVLQGRPAAQTAADGRFRFENVASGRYVLTVAALGWAADERTLVVLRDTTLTIELAPAPVPLDTLAVEAGEIDVRGVVRDAVSGFGLIDVQVYASPDRSTKTDPVGRFRFKEVLPNAPFVIQVAEMGYLPQNIAVIASKDTTVRVDMVSDSIALRMIDGANRFLAERAAPRAYRGTPSITREYLLRNVNRSVSDVLNEVLRTRVKRIRCVVIDERRSTMLLLETMLPDRVEHIDIVEFGRQRRYIMVRVYTRSYFPALMRPHPDVISQDQLMQASRLGRCR